MTCEISCSSKSSTKKNFHIKVTTEEQLVKLILETKKKGGMKDKPILYGAFLEFIRHNLV